ncbi:2,3-diphosphoglycerate-dependent phosphoglycerate mutase [Neobacillus sp. PS3-34]|uniref:2,3-diphosphoglycerate-dependent phosphoglycerate mutase n=1 Tax=Neobacillus sp. PS3-34 TaxID=3070678 RepID=UPI0027E04402|nr:2,3-diphosphoglycerate-dependent phosphoglycerate mutase [Neobacillus sp. PS3-34]WML48215.1 2,3-diphosphoglycerate-dependent phosphoglycerate mutase [Neobacillus sp. PS3-34]
MKKIVFIRHGLSQYNVENRFTGWKDIDLTDQGYNEAREAALVLKKHGFIFDTAHTSVLKRAIRTLWIILHEMDLMWIPVLKSWRLNERHYGALQGLNKNEVISKYGEEQVNIWRRSASIRPPEIYQEDHIFDQSDPKYKGIGAENIPLAESLEDTEKRAIIYWNEQIVPSLILNQRIIISAHGNTLRALVKYLDNIPPDGVISLNIPNSIPLVYEMDENLKPLRHYYLCQEGERSDDTMPLNQDLNDPDYCDWLG